MCEMGVNECGVAIGNEAVFTREPYDRHPGLIGMDCIRRALERADTERRALDTIVELLDTYGQEGRITVETMMASLRDHGPRAAVHPTSNPGRGWLMDTLCVHASFGPTRPSRSTGAMVAHLGPDLPTAWLTGTSGTCTGVFKPVYLGGAGLPALGSEPAGTCDPDSLWWAHERLHRAVIRGYPTRLLLYRDERDALEGAFLSEAAGMYDRYRGVSAEERAAPLGAFTASCFERAASATGRWSEAVSSVPVRHRPPRLFSMAWDSFNRQAAFA
jgi:secernin